MMYATIGFALAAAILVWLLLRAHRLKAVWQERAEMAERQLRQIAEDKKREAKIRRLSDAKLDERLARRVPRHDAQ